MIGPVDSHRPTSNRIAIARLAERVVGADPGVSLTQGGDRWLTRDGDRVIGGIVVAASAGGRVDVSLHLVAHLPPRPLRQQAAALRSELRLAVGKAGLAETLGEVDVTIHDLREPGEGAAAA